MIGLKSITTKIVKVWILFNIEMEDGSKVLRSFNTYVCKIDPDKTFHKTWSEYSPTTMRHINAFLDYYGIEGGGKKWWESLPCEDY